MGKSKKCDENVKRKMLPRICLERIVSFLNNKDYFSFILICRDCVHAEPEWKVEIRKQNNDVRKVVQNCPLRVLKLMNPPLSKIDDHAILLWCTNSENFSYLLSKGVSLKELQWNNNEILRQHSFCGNIEIVRLLLNMKNLPIGDVVFSLSNASGRGHLHVVEILFKYIKDNGGSILDVKESRALEYAAAHNHLNVVEYLFSIGFSVENVDRRTLRRCSGNSCLKTLKFFISKGLTIDRLREASVLSFACQNDDLEMVKFFIEDVGFDLNDVRADDNFVLLDSISEGYLEIVQYLLSLSINGQSLTIHDLLDDFYYILTVGMNLDILKFIVQYRFADGTGITTSHIKLRECGLLRIYCSKGELEELKFLMSTTFADGERLNVSDLSSSLEWTYDVEMIKYLLSLGVKDVNGSAKAKVFIYGYTEIVSLLDEQK